MRILASSVKLPSMPEVPLLKKLDTKVQYLFNIEAYGFQMKTQMLKLISIANL